MILFKKVFKESIVINFEIVQIIRFSIYEGLKSDCHREATCNFFIASLTGFILVK